MAEAKDDIVLSIRGMCKSFGRNRVLDHINLDVKRGTVMGLMGENGAGKSTMMKCLFGTYQKDEGKIFLNGKEISFSGPKDALENGIAMVHQELNQCLERSVIDNLFLGRYPVNSMGVVDEGQMKKKAADLFRKLGMTVNLTQPMRNMSVSQRQMCEIAKAISYNAQVIVLDEPTSSLTVQEVNKLFEMMRMLKEQGIALIYISHKMDEIFEICDQISVLRDGNLVMTKDSKDTNMGELITAMVGRSLESRFPPVDNIPGDTILSIQHLSTKYAPYLQDISFDVREGEIFGLYGLVGAGRTELAMSLFGKSYGTKISGSLKLNGEEVHLKNVRDAIHHKLAYVTEDRKGNGLILSNPIKINTTLANLDAISRHGVIDQDEEYAIAVDYKEKLRTKCPSVEQNVGNLSGGNQQKVLLAKWMFADPDVLILDEPTRGIDVGAKYEIYCIINQLVAEGKSVIMISSELPEVLGMCDRIYIMNEGRIVGELQGEEASQEIIMSHILKSSNKGA